MNLLNQNMNLMGRTPGVIYMRGLPVFEDINAIIRKRIFTKKQTRKFKNTRWVKKYKKKYSYVKLIPQIILDSSNQCYYAHPAIINHLKRDLNT